MNFLCQKCLFFTPHFTLKQLEKSRVFRPRHPFNSKLIKSYPGRHRKKGGGWRKQPNQIAPPPLSNTKFTQSSLPGVEWGRVGG